jgi:hypothetical protein
MMQEVWKLFPKILEQKINALLDEAEPNPFKAFQIYKTCQSENLWNSNFTKFSICLSDFYAIPKSERTKGKFDIYLDRPMHNSIFCQFALNFRTCTVDLLKLSSLSSWTHNLMRINLKTNSIIISSDVINRTLKFITNPPQFEKTQDIEFDDFCKAWKRIVLNLFGKKYETEMHQILSLLKELQEQRKLSEKHLKFIPQLFLTQTEIDWCSAVQRAANLSTAMPKFPLSRGPKKEKLVQLYKIVQLYSYALDSDDEKLRNYQDRIRTTLIYACEEIEQIRAK